MDKVDSSEVVVIVVVDRLAHVRRLSFDVRVGGGGALVRVLDVGMHER